MGTIHILMMGYLHTQEEYRDAEKILRTLTSVAEQGYLITTSEEGLGFQEGGPPPRAGLSPRLYPHLEAYLAGTEPYLSAQAYAAAPRKEGRWGFSYGCLSLSAEDEILLVDVDDWHFTLHRSDDPRYPQWKREVQALYAHWLDLLERTYRIWHPLYCYDFSACSVGLWPETSLADARALQPQHLYHHNLLGPELVKKIGRDRLVSAPAWQIRDFEDGSVLVIPNDLYGEAGSDNMPAVAQALHIPYDAGALEWWLNRHRPRQGENGQN